MKTKYKTQGTCSTEIDVDIDDNHVLQDVQFVGGCPGNTLGISTLVRGMKAEDVINRLQGLRCGYKRTSCPDQLASALVETLKQMNTSREN